MTGAGRGGTPHAQKASQWEGAQGATEQVWGPPRADECQSCTSAPREPGVALCTYMACLCTAPTPIHTLGPPRWSCIVMLFQQPRGPRRVGQELTGWRFLRAGSGAVPQTEHTCLHRPPGQGHRCAAGGLRPGGPEGGLEETDGHLSRGRAGHAASLLRRGAHQGVWSHGAHKPSVRGLHSSPVLWRILRTTCWITYERATEAFRSVFEKLSVPATGILAWDRRSRNGAPAPAPEHHS